MSNKPNYWEDPMAAPPQDKRIGKWVGIKGRRESGTVLRIHNDGRAVIDFGPSFGMFGGLSGEVTVSPELIEWPLDTEGVTE